MVSKIGKYPTKKQIVFGALILLAFLGYLFFGCSEHTTAAQTNEAVEVAIEMDQQIAEHLKTLAANGDDTVKKALGGFSTLKKVASHTSGITLTVGETHQTLLGTYTDLAQGVLAWRLSSGRIQALVRIFNADTTTDQCDLSGWRFYYALNINDRYETTWRQSESRGPVFTIIGRTNRSDLYSPYGVFAYWVRKHRR